MQFEVKYTHLDGSGVVTDEGVYDGDTTATAVARKEELRLLKEEQCRKYHLGLEQQALNVAQALSCLESPEIQRPGRHPGFAASTKLHSLVDVQRMIAHNASWSFPRLRFHMVYDVGTWAGSSLRNCLEEQMCCEAAEGHEFERSKRARWV